MVDKINKIGLYLYLLHIYDFSYFTWAYSREISFLSSWYRELIGKIYKYYQPFQMLRMIYKITFGEWNSWGCCPARIGNLRKWAVGTKINK